MPTPERAEGVGICPTADSILASAPAGANVIRLPDGTAQRNDGQSMGNWGTETVGRGAVLAGYRTNFTGATSPRPFWAARHVSCEAPAAQKGCGLGTYCHDLPWAQPRRAFGGRSSSRREKRQRRGSGLDAWSAKRDQREPERSAGSRLAKREALSLEPSRDEERDPAWRFGKGERLSFKRSPSRAAPAARVHAAPAIILGQPEFLERSHPIDDYGGKRSGGEGGA